MVADVSIKTDLNQLQYLTLRLAGAEKKVKRVLSGAVNDTVRQEVTNISRLIRARVNIRAKDINKNLRKAFSRPSENPTGRIDLEKTARLSLKYFGARQTKKGVTYKINKAGSRRLAAGAFIPKDVLGEHVYRRVRNSRLPIVKLLAVSAWGVFTKGNMDKLVVKDAKARLPKNLNRRVRLELLRASGLVKT